ncbi:YegP family protein [Pedococcus sp. 5OH_020]|uniref:YegP family protein n=1 Tax=Pedococcus sp. 5OH_020 TaxID=2989814 RepID=UPI003FA712BA
MGMRFSVSNDAGGQPTWRLYGDNEEMVAWAGESFASRSNATRAAEAFKARAATARFELYADAGQRWRWRAWASSDKVAASGESFDNRSNAQRAADNVQANAGSATGP